MTVKSHEPDAQPKLMQGSSSERMWGPGQVGCVSSAETKGWMQNEPLSEGVCEVGTAVISQRDLLKFTKTCTCWQRKWTQHGQLNMTFLNTSPTMNHPSWFSIFHLFPFHNLYVLLLSFYFFSFCAKFYVFYFEFSLFVALSLPAMCHSNLFVRLVSESWDCGSARKDTEAQGYKAFNWGKWDGLSTYNRSRLWGVTGRGGHWKWKTGGAETSPVFILSFNKYLPNTFAKALSYMWYMNIVPMELIVLGRKIQQAKKYK